MAAAFWPWPSSSQPHFSTKYDWQIRQAAREYWITGPDWRWLKAQLYQESLLDPDAVSPVGAAGLGQFMPATWEEVTRAMGWEGVSRSDAGYAIEAAAFYMRRLQRGWSSPRPAMDRHRLAQASYNAGFGNLLKAQKLCGGPALYIDIVACLPMVTGRHSQETITYVIKIQKWREMMP